MERGTTIVEYALLVSLVTLVAVTSMSTITNPLPSYMAEVAKDDAVPSEDDPIFTTTTSTTTCRGNRGRSQAAAIAERTRLHADTRCVRGDHRV